MPTLALALVVLTTVANAFALVLQRKAAQDAARGGGPTTLRALARRPAWSAGLAIFAVAVALQATALSLGPIALVQPVLVMALPFTLLLGRVVLGGALRRRESVAVAAMTAGLALLLATLRPGGGDALGAGTDVWVAGSAATLGGLVLIGMVAERRTGAARAALHGVAAGIGSGFVAVVVKAMTVALAEGGPAAVLATWQSYLLVPAAPLAFLALQRALRAGRLLASQPGLVLANPLLASCWGVGLLGEGVRTGTALLGGVLGALLLTAGAIVLARSPLLGAQEARPSVRVPT